MNKSRKKGSIFSGVYIISGIVKHPINCGNYRAKKSAKPPLYSIEYYFNFTVNSNIIMTNNSVHSNFIIHALRSAVSFWGNLFVSTTTKEFNRLKNFIAS